MTMPVNLLGVQKLDNGTSFWVGLGQTSLVEGKGHTSRASECRLPINSNVKH